MNNAYVNCFGEKYSTLTNTTYLVFEKVMYLSFLGHIVLPAPNFVTLNALNNALPEDTRTIYKSK